MNLDDFPAPKEGFVITHVLVVADQDRSRRFYRSLLGGQVLLERGRAEGPRAEIVGRWFTTSPWFSVVAGLPEMRGRSVSSQAWPKLVSI
jgi:hypothetical protein